MSALWDDASVLPFLPLAQGDIDYAVDARGDMDAVLEVLRRPATTVMLTRSGMVAVPKGQGKPSILSADGMRLATLPGSYVEREIGQVHDAIAMVLGTYGGVRDEHIVAVDITHVGEGERGFAVPDAAHEGVDDEFDEVSSPCAPMAQRPMLEQAVHRFDWADLRTFAPRASAREAGQATTAVTLGLWHARQRHCPMCGSRVQPALSGWAQRCTSPQDGNRVVFPRIEPAVITAVMDDEERLLVQHNRAWSDERLYSVSAGFVEAGENLEHACRREALEEVGITVDAVHYVGSQPWPFPASLMMAFMAHAATTAVRIDGREVTDARWMSRDEYRRAITDGTMVAPGKATIARYMIEHWLGHPLQ